MNFLPLYLMFCLGLIAGPIVTGTGPKAMRIAAALWVVVWCGPPLVALWIAGVSG